MRTATATGTGIAMLALLFAIGCGGELVPSDGTAEVTETETGDGTETIGSDFIPEDLDRETLDLVREAIEIGLVHGKSVVADGINSELARHGIDHNYVGGESLVDISDDVVSECPFVQNAGNDGSTSVSCRFLAEQARDNAYIREANMLATIELDSRFDSDRPLHESWLANGLASGIDGEFIMSVRRLREALVCDQEPGPVESSREAGVAQGRRLMEEAVEAQLAVTPVTECDIDNGIVNPALTAALAQIPAEAEARPLCPTYAPTDMDDRAAFHQAENEHQLGIRQGVEEGSVIAAERLFRTWVCQTPAEEGGGGGGGGGGDPLVLDLDGDGVRTTGPAQGVSFRLGRNSLHRTGWLADSDDGFLAIDHNGNGTIDDGTELMGDQSWTADSLWEQNGLLSLARYDNADMGGNSDGVIDARDAIFGALVVWQDRNLNGRSDAGEVAPLADHGIDSVTLDYVAGDGTLETAFEREDGSIGNAVDVWFRFF